jgi:hypothetical protein
MGFWINKNNGEYVGERTKKQELLGLILCIGFICLFVWLFLKSWNDYTAMEAGKKNLEVDNLSYVLYNVGGKWLATSFWLLLITVFAFFGFKRWKGFKKAEDQRQ